MSVNFMTQNVTAIWHSHNVRRCGMFSDLTLRHLCPVSATGRLDTSGGDEQGGVVRGGAAMNETLARSADAVAR